MIERLSAGTPFTLPATEEGRRRMHDALLSVAPRIEYFTAGRSVCARELIVYKIGNGRGRVALFAAHHALESITANVLYAFVYAALLYPEALCIGGHDPRELLSLYTFFVMPCVNPDGIELRFTGDTRSPIRERVMRMSGGDFSNWQANERGVDLNHNYEYGFAEYKRIEREREIVAGATLYSGEYPESEPESRTVASLLRIIAPRAAVSLHSQGEEIFFSPPSATTLARRLSALCDYGVSTPSGTAAYGGLCDYTGGVLGIPSFTLELGRGKNPLDESEVPSIFARVGRALFSLPLLLQ